MILHYCLQWWGQFSTGWCESCGLNDFVHFIVLYKTKFLTFCRAVVSIFIFYSANPTEWFGKVCRVDSPIFKTWLRLRLEWSTGGCVARGDRAWSVFPLPLEWHHCVIDLTLAQWLWSRDGLWTNEKTTSQCTKRTSVSANVVLLHRNALQASCDVTRHSSRRIRRAKRAIKCCLAARRCDCEYVTTPIRSTLLSPVSTSRVDGPCWLVLSTRLVEMRARQHGPCWRVMETGHRSTRAVNSGRQLG